MYKQAANMYTSVHKGTSVGEVTPLVNYPRSWIISVDPHCSLTSV